MKTPAIPEPVHVLVAFDLSPGGRVVVDRALDIALRAPNHVLHFLCVIDPRTGVPAVRGRRFDYRYADQVRDAVTAHVEDALSARETSTSLHLFVHARFGIASEEILLAARELSADLIIIGSHGYSGVKRMLLGSVSEQVVREAGCPVVVARRKAYPPAKLLDIIDVGEHASPYNRPHRYHYEDARLAPRPADWPIY